jgi:hypothetical protein
MLLTVPWVGGLFVGRCDLENGRAKDRVLTRKFGKIDKVFDTFILNLKYFIDLVNTGVECESDVKIQARIMIATSFSYLIIQGIAFGYLSNIPLIAYCIFLIILS